MVHLLLRGDFHTHPLGHGPLKEDPTLRNYHGPDPEPPPDKWHLPGSDEREARVRAMLHAAVEKRLDFICLTDHVFNTYPIARRVLPRNPPIIVIPGFEASPVSTDPARDHVLVIGVDYRVGQAFTNFTLAQLRALVLRRGGLLANPHPVHTSFWLRGKARRMWDAVEQTNCGYTESWDRGGKGFPRMSNSDAHNAQALLDRPCYNTVDADEASARGIIAAVLAGRITPSTERL